MSKALTGDAESLSLSVSVHSLDPCVGTPLASLYPGPDGLTAENIVDKVKKVISLKK